MSLVEFADSELVELEDFFAPAPYTLFGSLMEQYTATRQRLEALAEAVRSSTCSGVLGYFVAGNCPDQRQTVPNTVDTLFALAPAVAQLDATFWQRALDLTDVFAYMPQARRSAWHEQIRQPMGEKDRYSGQWKVEPIPAFEEETVRATIESLLDMRAQFFAERVDGIFRALSRKHVTNSPQGFRQRMILQRALCEWGTVNWNTAGVINDLRTVIAKFMGRDEPRHGATDELVKICRRNAGQWMPIDGGALRMRVYAGVGTAHLEVHPDMAWRLNAILAHLHPAAIPAEFRERPKRERKVKQHPLFNRPLPFAVLGLLGSMKPGYRRKDELARDGRPDFVDIPRTRRFDHGDKDPVALKQAEAVLAAIGGVREKHGHVEFWRFDYEPGDALDQIVCSGVIPDQQSHQFYPTPDDVAQQAVALAAESSAPGHRWLEPSAGTGNLVALFPEGMLVDCVEVSELHGAILRARGHEPIVADFLQMPTTGRQYDRIVMNPPFSEGRWQAHVEHAAAMLKPGGRLVAIVPASARGKSLLPGYSAVWSDVLENRFAGTGVAVAIVSLTRSGAPA
jgi:hypothetical protein